MTCSECGQPDELGCGCVADHSLLGFLQDFRTTTVSRPAPPAERPSSPRRPPVDRRPSTGAPLDETIHASDLVDADRALQATMSSPPSPSSSHPATNAPQPWNPNLAPESAGAPSTGWGAPMAQPPVAQQPVPSLLYPAPAPGPAGSPPWGPGPSAGYQPPAQFAPIGVPGRERQNRLATASIFMALGSFFMPPLSIPGVILGVKSLRRIRLQPWLDGRSRSITGIVASLILGPLVGIAVVLGVLHGLHKENMGHVQSAVRALVVASLQQQSATLPHLTVSCPASEPKRAGIVFICRVTDTDTGRTLAVQARETDSGGDIIVTPVLSEGE
jgi:hypothetical protein